jgi:hypothetical protein
MSRRRNFVTTRLLFAITFALVASGIPAGALQFPPPPPIPAPPTPPPPPHPSQAGTTSGTNNPLATPVVVVGSVRNIGTRYAVDYTVCNVDSQATYSTNVVPGQQAPLFAGSPPEDFGPGIYSGVGSSMTPPCPSGLQHPGGLKNYGPGPLTGDRPCGGNVTHAIVVTATRNAQRVVGRGTYVVTAVGPCPTAPPPPPAPPQPNVSIPKPKIPPR